MNAALRASDRCAVVGVVDPDVSAAGDHSTGWISAANFYSFMAVAMVGTLGTSATADFKIEQASDSGGTGAKDVTGKAITQLTQAGSDSDKQAVINLTPDDLDVDGGFTHFRATLTIATATSDAGVIVLGLDPRYAPASDNDAASVAEIV